MVRTLRHSMFVLLLALCAVQFFATACSDGCVPGSPGPLQADNQLPGSPEGETEGDQGELEELALAQGEAFRVIHLRHRCMVDSTSCPRTDFVSDWFRPPALS
jgi:hypothetical protein